MINKLGIDAMKGLVKKFLQIKTVFFLVLFLSACGFHIRQYQDLSPGLKTLNITSLNPRSSIKALLAENLQGMGVILTPSAPVNLNILSENFSQSTSAIGTAQQLNAVILTYTVTIVLENSRHVQISPPVVLTANTTYLQNANQILGDIGAASDLKQSLMRRMAQQILAYLSAENTRHALSDHR